jgi:hypothetical protein
MSDCAICRSETSIKASKELLGALQDISRHLQGLSSDPTKSELDTDAIVDLNLACESVDKLIPGSRACWSEVGNG